MPPVTDPNLLVGVATRDDAAVYRISDDVALIQTLDFFPPIVDDSYWYGAIAVANSLSDVYAMGGRPIVAMNILCWPPDIDKSLLTLVMRGGFDKAAEAGVLIVGGHSIQDQEPKYGLSVTGVVTPGEQVSNIGAEPGDVLVLTKPIGTGIITTAAKAQNASQEVIDLAISTMARLNRDASEAMLAVGAHSCTDVTGFGLLGHLRGMVDGSQVTAVINASSVPVLEGTWELLQQGNVAGGTQKNLQALEDEVAWGPNVSIETKVLLCDAQTSGGLLIALPSDKVDSLTRDLSSRGVESAVIGEMISREDSGIRVVS